MRGSGLRGIPERNVLLHWSTRRLSSTASNANKKLPGPFEDIPRANSFPVVRFLWQSMLPRNFNIPLYQQQQEKLKKYGVIYRDGPFSVLSDCVVVHRPEDVEAVFFKAEGRYPSRCTVSASKAVRKELGIGMGITFLENEEWFDKRIPIAKFTLAPKKVREFHKDFNIVAHDLLLAVRNSRDQSEVVHDVTSLLFNWSFECISLFVLGKRMGCIPDPLQTPPDCKSVLQSVQTFFRTKHETAMGLDLPLFVQRTTEPWRALSDATSNVYTTVLHYVEQKLNKIKEEDCKIEELSTSDVSKKVDFLTYIIQSGMLSMKDATLNSVDLIGGGVDTTSLVLAWVLYCLAINPEKQYKLRAEVHDIVGASDVVTPEHINAMPYLKGCIKETLRLYPVATSTRVLKEDVILSNYHVPAGTSILVPLTVIGRMPDIFPEPLRYMPERWYRDGKSSIHMFASLPFGFGPRMCVGRRIAELEIHIALAQIMKNFEISFPDKLPLDIADQAMSAVPNRPLNVRFRDL